MRKVIPFIFMALLGLTACSGQILSLFTDNYGDNDPTENTTANIEGIVESEVFEIIRDLRGREIRIAAHWSYLPFVTGGSMPNLEESLNARRHELDMMFYNQVQRISQEYNINLQAIHIEHQEIMPTLQTSVMARNPFADMVLLGSEMILPAITGNLIYALEEFVPPDADLWGNQNWVRPSANFIDLYWAFAPYSINFEGVFLGVNQDIIREIGADNPVTLYEGGQWTFDRFWEIMHLAASQPEQNRFGISGAPGDIITHLIAANDGVMVYNFNYAYDNPNTMAALQFAHQIFSTDNIWQNNHHIQDRDRNFFAFLERQSAFFPISEWALQQANIDFPYSIVPFPRGPNNESSYTFMKGFGMGLSVPRGVRNPQDVYTIFEGISQWSGDNPNLQLERDQEYFISLFASDSTTSNRLASDNAIRVINILNNQGKFDIGLAIPGFDWMHSILAEGFINGSMNVPRAVEQFRRPQQEILDTALENWVIRE